MIIDPITAPHVQGGGLGPLATVGAGPLGRLPDVPHGGGTRAGAAVTRRGLVRPVRPRLGRRPRWSSALNRDFNDSLAQPEVEAALRRFGLKPEAIDPEELARRVFPQPRRHRRGAAPPRDRLKRPEIAAMAQPIEFIGMIAHRAQSEIHPPARAGGRPRLHPPLRPGARGGRLRPRPGRLGQHLAGRAAGGLPHRGGREPHRLHGGAPARLRPRRRWPRGSSPPSTTSRTAAPPLHVISGGSPTEQPQGRRLAPRTASATLRTEEYI